MEIVDAQIHLWKADSADRPWPVDRAAGAHGESMSAQEMLGMMDRAGVSRAIIVPPSWEGDRNDYALDAVSRFPGKFAIMGRLAIEDPAGQDQLASWKRQPGMLGMRFTFHSAHHKHWLRDGMADWLWPLAEKYQIPLMVNVPGSVRIIDEVARKYPQLKLTIDHLACEAGKKDEEAFYELPNLLHIARHPNVSVKASAVARYTNEQYPYPNTQIKLKRIFDVFGPERFFWGSDISRLPCTYTQAVTLFTEELTWLTPNDLEFVMGKALCQWLDWKDPF